MPLQTCESCRFSAPYLHRDTILCRRFPPTLPPRNPTSSRASNQFPAVRTCYWCGEYQALLDGDSDDIPSEVVDDGDLPEPEPEEDLVLMQLPPTEVGYWNNSTVFSPSFDPPGRDVAAEVSVEGGRARFSDGSWGSSGIVQWNSQLRTQPPDHGWSKTVTMEGPGYRVEWTLTRSSS